MTNGGAKVPDAVQWHEGMLLAPQHFQQADLRTEALVAHVAASTTPYGWGVHAFRLDPVALPNGVLRVLELDAILPDGLVVQYDPERDPELSIDLTQIDEVAPGQDVSVHLVVGRRQESAALASGSSPRYRSVESLEVLDLNTGEDPLAVPRLRPAARLIAGPEIPERFVGFTLARIAVQGDVYALQDYTPPALTLRACPELSEAVRARAARLRERAVYLQDQLKKGGVDPSRSSVVRSVRQLRGLVQGLPVLEGVLGSPEVHPFQLYLALAGYLGSAASVRDDYVPPPVPRYVHGELTSTFRPLLNAMDEIERLVHQAFRTEPFSEREDGFTIRLPADVDDRLVVGVQTGGILEGDTLRRWIETAQIATADRMELVRLRRVRGAVRRIVERYDPLGVQSAPGLVLLEVETDPEYVTPAGELHLIPATSMREARPQQLLLYLPAR